MIPTITAGFRSVRTMVRVMCAAARAISLVTYFSCSHREMRVTPVGMVNGPRKSRWREGVKHLLILHSLTSFGYSCHEWAEDGWCASKTRLAVIAFFIFPLICKCLLLETKSKRNRCYGFAVLTGVILILSLTSFACTHNILTKTQAPNQSTDHPYQSEAPSMNPSITSATSPAPTQETSCAPHSTCPPIQTCPPSPTCPPQSTCPPIQTCPPSSTCPPQILCPANATGPPQSTCPPTSTCPPQIPCPANATGPPQLTSPPISNTIGLLCGCFLFVSSFFQ